MKKLFSPILNHFEKGEARYAYKPLHRTILNVVAVLFLVIASGSLFAAIKFSVLGGLIPAVVFLAGSIVCAVVGLLGSDKAVANMWKTR
ncbi:hypothetical protein OOT55_11645 [Marinimicrobium sp. C6131]|uniref:hypothetical protein n=1 Tax=Marinimicrobium sp. C6131 TaxID=3022676 RepID=UPI00223DC10B|nr:hypothetical protein [Marinimicrobium sp. C6131]UZJ43304.1 hypothetical protein OOT55_11645 [Marinimicrobium sp. C6131]